MAMEQAIVKHEQSFTELTCGTENVSPYSSTSGYSDQSYYQQDYDWHQHQQHYQPHEQPHHQHPHQQTHTLQTPQLTDLSSRQYYGSYQESHEPTTTAGTYPAFSHHALQQADFYNPVLWPNSQANYIPTTSLPTSPRLFSGIDMSQHAVVGLPAATQQQTTASTKPKRKRVQSYSQRKAANVRERRRMFHLNEAFDKLRKRLPAFNYEKRLSRIETLRLAMTYISFMKDVSVGQDPKCVKLKPHGLDLECPGEMSELCSQHPSLSSESDELPNVTDNYSDNSNDSMNLHSGHSH